MRAEDVKTHARRLAGYWLDEMLARELEGAARAAAAMRVGPEVLAAIELELRALQVDLEGGRDVSALSFEQLGRAGRALQVLELEDLANAIRTACGAVDDEYVRACWVQFDSNRFAYVLSRQPVRQGELLLELGFVKLTAKERVGG